jgi:RNA polymerase sigma-70 factor, ECF subfamily
MNQTQQYVTPATSLSDEEIVGRVVGGDSSQFEILMRRHNQRLYRAVRAVLRSDDEVEDVMQQAWLNAYSHLHQFAGTALFSTWLTRIAVNEALSRRKKRGESWQGEEGSMLTLVDTKTASPEDAALTADLRHVLEAEVSALPDTLRPAFMLREVEGMSTLEAAEALGISEDLVKTRLHRARVQLRERLYSRAGITLEKVFEFGNSRCDAIVADVMEKIRCMK